MEPITELGESLAGGRLSWLNGEADSGSRHNYRLVAGAVPYRGLSGEAGSGAMESHPLPSVVDWGVSAN